jgi:glycosyltransferase involved in cell wall biosynthesis
LPRTARDRVDGRKKPFSVPVPLISVLLPCRDAEATVTDALASLAAQTFGDFEIIAVDDGSIDRTRALLHKWVRRDNRIRIIATEPQGIVNALNTAVADARGVLLARMDADDVAHRTRLARQVHWLDSHPELAACGTQIRYFPRRLVRAGARRYEQWINGIVSPKEVERDLFVECPIPHPTLVIRREALDAAGAYRDQGWPEDYDLMLRLWRAGYQLGKVPEVLLSWRESQDRLSRTDSRYSEDAFRRCKVHYLSTRIAERPVLVCGAGPVGKAFALALKEKGHRIAALVDLDPRRIGQMIHGAEVIPPKDIKKHRETYALAAVASENARFEIRAYLRAAGFREPEDCCAVA